MDWRCLSPSELHLAFNNGAAVGPDVAAAKTAGWVAASATMRAAHDPCHLDVPYMEVG